MRYIIRMLNNNGENLFWSLVDDFMSGRTRKWSGGDLWAMAEFAFQGAKDLSRETRVAIMNDLVEVNDWLAAHTALTERANGEAFGWSKVSAGETGYRVQEFLPR